MKRCTAIAALLLLAAPATYAAEGWRYGLSADVVHDDNATRGLYDGKKSDNIVALEGAATRSVMLGPNSGALFRAAARYSHFTDIKDLSNLALIGRAAWRHQPSRAFGAPWYELAGQAQLLRHADSEIRDGSILSIDASAGANVTDRTRLAGGLGLDKRSGGGSAGVYDLSNTRFWGSLDLRVGVRATLYARLTHQTGDQVFNVIPALVLGVWDVDPALASAYGAPGNAYRVDATTLIYDFGFNYPLASGQALDFSFTRISSKAEEGPAQGNKYNVNQVRATYLYRFQ
jgi:hypothetical protein